MPHVGKRYRTGDLAITIGRFHTIEEAMSTAVAAGASGEPGQSICNYRPCLFSALAKSGSRTTGEIPEEIDTIDPETLAKIQEYARKRSGKRARKPKIS
jgi:hypothetical protein